MSEQTMQIPREIRFTDREAVRLITEESERTGEKPGKVAGRWINLYNAIKPPSDGRKIIVGRSSRRANSQPASTT